jgi:hypothetical protein
LQLIMAQGIKYNTKEELTNALIALIFPNNQKLITGAKTQQAVLDLAESLWDQGGYVNVNIDDSTAEFLEDKLVEGSGITLSVIDTGGVKTIEISSTALGTDEFVKVQADDSTAEFLGDKIVAGTNVTINVLDNAGVKTLEISASGGAVTDELVKISATDTTTGYLGDKLIVGDGLSTTINNPGANEIIQLDLVVNDLAIYYVDGNNTNIGTGSITDPFQTIDRAVQRVLGELPGLPAPTNRVKIVVRGYSGNNYIVTRNLWLNADWEFETGADIQANSATHESDTLFDQQYYITNTNPSSGAIIAPNIYGGGEFALNGVDFFTSANISSLTNPPANTRYSIEFDYIECEACSAITLNATKYATGNFHNYIIKGQGRGQIYMKTNGSYHGLKTISDGSDIGVFEIYNVFFVDSFTGDANGVAMIDIEDANACVFQDIRFFSGSDVTRPSYIILRGNCHSFYSDGLIFTKGNHSAAVAVFDIRTTGGTTDNRITNSIVKMTSTSGDSRFLTKTVVSTNNEFAINNNISNVPVDGDLSTYTDPDLPGLNMLVESLYTGLPIYANEGDADLAGLPTDAVYKTAGGELRIKL